VLGRVRVRKPTLRRPRAGTGSAVLLAASDLLGQRWGRAGQDPSTFYDQQRAGCLGSFFSCGFRWSSQPDDRRARLATGKQCRNNSSTTGAVRHALVIALSE